MSEMGRALELKGRGSFKTGHKIIYMSDRFIPESWLFIELLQCSMSHVSCPLHYTLQLYKELITQL